MIGLPGVGSPESLRWAAAALAAGAAALLVRGRASRGGSGRPWQPLAAAGLVAVVAGGSGRTLVPASIVGAAAVAAWALWRRRSSETRARLVAGRVLETCELLAADLRAGRPPGEALAAAAREWPALAPAAEAFTFGADVPEALRRLARAPGAGELELLAAAWQVAHRSGQGLAETVCAVAEQLKADRATRRVVESELASARATARLVAALPVAALVVGGGLGGDPWHFLLSTGAGLGCLAAGLGLMVGGLWWIERLSSAVLAA